MTRDFSEDGRIVVLGIGNSLLSDDGAGVHVISLLQMRSDIASNVVFRDGGTLGLSLLPEIEDAEGLIVVDAAEIGLDAGAVKTFEGDAVQAQLGGTKKTVHELALSDLMSAAALTGRAPRHVALVTIQPQSTEWGTEPTPAVTAALAEAGEAVVAVMQRWQAGAEANAAASPTSASPPPYASGGGGRHKAGQSAVSSGSETHTTGFAQAVLAEIATLTARLAKSGQPGSIDLTGLPMSDADRAELEVLLGHGEVEAELAVAGTSQVFETQYAGVWWVRHRAVGERITSETIEIAPIPEILMSHPADIAAAAARLEATVNQNAADMQPLNEEDRINAGHSHPR